MKLTLNGKREEEKKKANGNIRLISKVACLISGLQFLSVTTGGLPCRVSANHWPGKTKRDVAGKSGGGGARISGHAQWGGVADGGVGKGRQLVL